MTRDERPARVFSLKYRIQLLAAASLLFAVFVIVPATWVFAHYLSHDIAQETNEWALSLLQSEGRGVANYLGSRDAQEELDDMLRRNPDAWYYYEDSTQVISSSPGSPRYKGSLVGGHAQLSIDKEGTVICGNQSRFYFDSSDGRAQVMTTGCGDEAYYIEVVGFETGLSFWTHLWQRIKLGYLLEGRFKGRLALVALVAIATIGAITMMFGSLIKRVATVSSAASHIGKGEHHVRLPEDNLPREILPMVQAINRAIMRLEAASEQQSLFVAAAAHELRTPLTVTRTRLEELEDSDLKDALIGDLRRMNSMVTQLLALARLGAAELDLQKLNLVDVVRASCMERGGTVFGAGKELSFDASDGPADILGDPESVKTAVTNLIDNALIFTPEGKSVHVRVDGNRVAVSDEGPGVADEDKERIFEPFFKNPPNKRGHGLGLAIVSEIMRIHQGEVGTRNRPEGGAIFELTFQIAV